MKEMHSDILIVGGGLSGLTAALALSSTTTNIFLIDSFDFVNIEKNNNDLRTTAISEGSKQFFEKLKIWNKIVKFAEPIRRINVIDRNKRRNINFKNSNNKENLGYIVRNLNLKKILIKELKLKKNIKLIKNQKIKNITNSNDFILAQGTSINFKSSFLVAADGKNSFVRKINKTPTYNKIYPHKALVINFNHTKNHSGTAHELFYKKGPLAILPMIKKNNNFYTSSLIWSNEISFVDSLVNTKKEILISVLEEKISDFVGEISDILDTQVFNLSAHINTRFYDERTVYLGDAAHSLHPIAGQGWNLGIRDIKNLLKIVEKNISLGMSLGNKNLCKDFHDSAYNDAFILYQATDKLNAIFMNDSIAINSIRKKGFSLIERSPALKKFITNYAMGI